MVKLFNDGLSGLRRPLHREATDVPRRAVLEGARWLLPKDAEDANPEEDQARLEEALRLDEPLAVAYDLEEDVRRSWERPGKRFATAFLAGWIRRAAASGIKVLRPMAKTLAAHRSGLPAYDDVMIGGGPTEGTNAKIETMERPAYGFGDRESFKPKVLAIHETKYALVGWYQHRMSTQRLASVAHSRHSSRATPG